MIYLASWYSHKDSEFNNWTHNSVLTCICVIVGHVNWYSIWLATSIPKWVCMVGQLKSLKKINKCPFLLQPTCVARSHTTPRTFSSAPRKFIGWSAGISIGLTTKHSIFIYLCHLKELFVHFRWQHVVPSCTWLQRKTQLPMKPLHQRQNGRKFAPDAYCQRYKCVVNYHSYRECIKNGWRWPVMQVKPLSCDQIAGTTIV